MSPARPLALALALAACSDPPGRPRPNPTADVPRADVAADAAPDDVTADAAPDDVTADAVTADAANDAPSDAAPDVATARLRVLFVGNSYTYYNDLPMIVSRIGDAAARAGRGPSIESASVAVGGATIRNHWDTGDAPRRIMSESWDAVVLQGQSVEPALNFTEFRTYGVRFGMLANTYRARPVYYATWPRRAGDAVYMESWSGGTPEAFNGRLHTAYSQVAAQVMGAVAPVGNVWMAALAARPSVTLYDADGSHPSPSGSWLAACVLYRALAGVAAPPESDGAATGVAPADARALRELASAP
ncbi:MAG: SGNH/GDSL hydrolase family protein [Polyangiales bacterium]